MSDISLDRLRGMRLGEGVRALRAAIDPALMRGALIFAALMPLTLVAMAVDGRTFQNDSVWLKPLKFEIALFVYLATLALYAAALPQRLRSATWFRAYLWVVVAACVVEIVWIGGAALFGVASHFNTQTAFMADIYGLMGILAVILTSLTLVMGVVVLLGRTPTLARPLRHGLGLGLILTFALTIPTASYMASQDGHFVGAAPTPADTLWFFGWARDGGDLRVPHFFATHAMHVIPAVGVVALAVPARAGVMVVWLCAAAYAAFVAATFFAATAGQPFVPSPP